MQEINLGIGAGLMSPQLFGALITKDKSGKTNIMGLSWLTFVSLREGKMLFCTSSKGYTGKVIQETGKATFCTVTPALQDKILQCCKVHGDSVDKVAQFGIDLTDCEGFDTPLIKDAGVSFAMELDQYVDSGDHGIYIMKAKKVVKDCDGPYVMAFDGYSRLDTI